MSTLMRHKYYANFGIEIGDNKVLIAFFTPGIFYASVFDCNITEAAEVMSRVWEHIDKEPWMFEPWLQHLN